MSVRGYMSIYRSLWVLQVSVGVYRWLWVFMGVYWCVDGLSLWIHVSGGIWVCGYVCGYLWMAIVGYAKLWVFMGVYGCVWVSGGVCGRLWDSMSVYEYLVFDRMWKLGVYGGMGRGGNSEKFIEVKKWFLKKILKNILTIYSNSNCAIRRSDLHL